MKVLKTITRADWTAALRSGKYRKGRGRLRNNPSQPRYHATHCCLGVAYEVAGLKLGHDLGDLRISQFDLRQEPETQGYRRKVPYMDKDGKTLYQMLGITQETCLALACRNDREQDPVSFKAIADYIDALSPTEVDAKGYAV